MVEEPVYSNESTVYAAGTRVNIGDGTRVNLGDGGGYERPRRNQRRDAADTTASSGLADNVETLVTDQPKRGRRKSIADSAANGQAAEMIVGLVETLAVMRYGTDAAMAQTERKMMSNGLKDSLVNLPPGLTKQVASMSAPLMAAMGLLFYAQRLSLLEARRQANIAERNRSVQVDAVHAAERIVNSNANGFHPSPDANGQPPAKDTIQDIMG